MKIENLKLHAPGQEAYATTLSEPRPSFQFSILNFQFSILLALLLFVVLGGLLFFYRLADRDLWSSHEARAAQDAQSLLSDNRWGLPQLFDRKVEMQKPPLYYWLVAAIARLRDRPVDAWAVRLPPALAALGGILLVYALGVWRGRPLAGMIAALVLATAQHYTWLARVGRIDMPLTLAIASALVFFYLGRSCQHQQHGRGAWWWFLMAYLATAVAILLKGPIGLVLPAAVAGVWLLVEGDLPKPWQGRRWLRLAHELGLWWGLPLLVGLTLPWFVWVNQQTSGKFFQVFFWKHNVERGLGGGALAAHPWWFYGPRLAFDFLPWSPLVPVLAWLLIGRGWWQKDPEARFGSIWMLTMLVVLSCSRFKRADYLLPLYPGAAIFLGCTAERWYRSVKFQRAFAAAFCLIVCGCAVAWWVYVEHVVPQQESEAVRFAQEIRSRAPAPQLILFFRAEAHLLAFHVGQPIDTILEWENLDVWAGRPQTYYVVMPPENAGEWSQHLKCGCLEEVLRSKSALTGGRHAHPLVLLRTRPGAALSPP